jgi:hypothetical protein
MMGPSPVWHAPQLLPYRAELVDMFHVITWVALDHSSV